MGTVFEVGLTGGVKTIYTFTNSLDGAYPCSPPAISGSPFYGFSNILLGTTLGGGSNGYGTVFKLNSDGSGFTNLYDFTGCSDGEFPRNGLLIDGDTLYGTTSNSIFKINTDGSDFTRLASITNASQLLLSLSGNTLYGTTTNGGTNNLGMIFSIGTDGANFADLHAFSGGTSDGAIPMSGLELYCIGNFFLYGPTNLTLFGTTYAGGLYGFGMAFSINTDGSGFTDLHDFAGGTNDGAYPTGGLLATNNSVLEGADGDTTNYFYGTTSSGGANGGGTIFGMDLDGTGYQTLFSFTNVPGCTTNPEGTLVLVGQTLYGTTSEGGTGTGTNGAIFTINIDGTGFTDLFEFSGGTNGGSPVAGLGLPVVDNWPSIWSLETTVNLPAGNDLAYSIAIDNYDILYVNGRLVSSTNWTTVAQWSVYSSLAPYLHPGQNDIKVVIGGDDDTNDYFAMAVQALPALPNVLYGTTYGGGIYSHGSVFTIAYSNEDDVLYSFSNKPDGNSPVGDLVLSGGTLYGVTDFGGTNLSSGDGGTIFSVSADGSTYHQLYTFGLTNASDGANPEAGLLSVGNTLYGTTYQGGIASDGTIFSVNTDGSGYQVLLSFGTNGDGQYPDSPLVLISNVLYGTTSSGGSGGTIFRICTNGSNYETIHSFGSGNDAYYPAGTLAVSSNTLYGMTYAGGQYNNGAIFSFTLGSNSEGVLCSFTNPVNVSRGPLPNGLALSDGTLYGTTYGGGAGYGTIFSIGIGTNGAGFANLQSFGSGDNAGEFPQAGLMIRSNLLYGTTVSGGTNNYGIVFSLSTNGTNFSEIYKFIGSPDGANPEGGVCSP